MARGEKGAEAEHATLNTTCIFSRPLLGLPAPCVRRLAALAAGITGLFAGKLVGSARRVRGLAAFSCELTH